MIIVSSTPMPLCGEYIFRELDIIRVKGRTSLSLYDGGLAFVIHIRQYFLLFSLFLSRCFFKVAE